MHSYSCCLLVSQVNPHLLSAFWFAARFSCSCLCRESSSGRGGGTGERNRKNREPPASHFDYSSLKPQQHPVMHPGGLSKTYSSPDLSTGDHPYLFLQGCRFPRPAHVAMPIGKGGLFCCNTSNIPAPAVAVVEHLAAARPQQRTTATAGSALFERSSEMKRRRRRRG